MKKGLKLSAISIFVLSLILVIYANEAEAAAYLKFDGVDGEAKDDKHEKWIDVLSFSQTISRGDSGNLSARASSSPVFHDIVVVKELDKSSPKIAESIALGKVFPKVEIELTSSAGTYYVYELTNVLVTSYSVNGDAGERPTEEVSLNFEEIKVTYTEYGSDGNSKGNIEYNWKVEKGAK